MMIKFLAIAVAAMLVGSIGVVMADTTLPKDPADVCYDIAGNTRYVPAGQPCKANEQKTKLIPGTNPPTDAEASPATDPAAIAQAQLQKQVTDLVAKVAALQAQFDQAKKDSEVDQPSGSQGYVNMTKKQVDALPQKLNTKDADPSLPDSQVQQMPGQKSAQQPGKVAANKQTGSSDKVTRVTAPFVVVDSKGEAILDVREGNVSGGSQVGRGLTVFAENGSYAMLGSGSGAGYANLRMFKEAQEAPTVAMGIQSNTGLGQILMKHDEKTIVGITDNRGEAELDLFNSLQHPVVAIGSRHDNGFAEFNKADGFVRVAITTGGVSHGEIALSGENSAVLVYDFAIIGRARATAP